jgi:hypothetical protein
MDYRQIYAIKKHNEGRIKILCPEIPNTSGIYFFYREELEIKYGYVGQARNLLQRTAEHLAGYQHIDISLKKHGLYSEKNPCGYKLRFKEVPEEELDEQERYYIQHFASKGYQLRNNTVGGQDKGKATLDIGKSPKGYRDGLKQGYLNAQRDVSKWMKHLNVKIKSDKPNKIQEKALEKLIKFSEEKKENG